MAFKIPKQYQLLGKTWTVSVVPKDKWEDATIWGECSAATGKILVLKNLSDDATEQTFCHELIHTILLAMNHKLNKNEEFVDIFGGLLHQALKSSK